MPTWTYQQNTSAQVSGISVYNPCTPAAVSYKGYLYMFYVSSANDGIYYIRSKSPFQNWEAKVAIRDPQRVPRLSVMLGTSPSVVVYNDKLYLFYQGSGNDGTWYCSFDGDNWNQNITSIRALTNQSFLLETSPCPVVHGNQLFLFWNGSGNDGIWYTATVAP